MKIYSLAHPITEEVRYIGITSGNLETRLAGHIWDSKNKMSHKCSWIKTVLKSTGQKPKIELIEIISNADWELMEMYWISQFNSWGFNLVNTDIGGKGVIRNVCGRQRSIEAHKKPIYQFNIKGDFIKKWTSISEASIFFKCKSHNTISMCAKGKSKTSCGYRWSFDKTPNVIDNRSKSDQYQVNLIDIKTKEVLEFSSKLKAMKYLGYKSSYISKKNIKKLGYEITLCKI